MRTVLICHHDDDLNHAALPRWMASFSEVVGIVRIEETSVQKKARIKRELKRVGWLRFLDVLAFRLYHRIFQQRKDLEAEKQILDRLFNRYAPLPAGIPMLTTASPNSAETLKFLRDVASDLTIARCKVILKPEIFNAAKSGTYVMHPGICPEYRNAHGCFWALASGDLDKVGMTLLKVDAGIDTGPVYGYYSCSYDELQESHFVIQHRTVFDNLDAIRDKLIEIHTGAALPISTHGRESRNWGQPWLTSHLALRRAARRRIAMQQISLLYHDVIPSGSLPDSSGFKGADADLYKLDEKNFAAHLERITELGSGRVQLMSDASLPKSIAGPGPVLFTFDDGGVSALEPTATLLEKHGWRGHFFVVTDRIGEKGFLSASQIRELRARGHHIGSHSGSHPAGFSTIGFERMKDEWTRSRKRLQEILGEDVWSASVPGGYYSTEVARAADAAGYRVLFNSEPTATPERIGPLLVLGRYGVQRQTPATQALRLARADNLPRLAQWLAWNGKKPFKKLGGTAWLAFRKWFLKKTMAS